MSNLEKIKKIRQATGAGLSDIQQALKKAAGDEQKALKILNQSGAVKALAKKERKLAAGLVDSYIHLGRVGVLIEVQTETDFVARNKKFKDLVHDLCLQIASTNPKDIASLLKEPFIKDEAMTIQALVDQSIARLGENIDIRRFARYSLED